MTSTRSLISLGAALAGLTALVASAAAAAAPTLTTDRSCYTRYQTIRLSGSGYQPGSAQTVSIDGVPLPVTKNGGNTFIPTAQGNVPANATLPAPPPAPGTHSVRTYTISASSSPSGSPVTAQTTFRVVHTNVDVDPPFITAGRVNFKALGFTYGPKVYIHYLKGRRQRHVATRLLGPTYGPCGRLRKRARMFLFRPVPPATYTLVFDNSPAYVAGYRPNFSFEAVVATTYF